MNWPGLVSCASNLKMQSSFNHLPSLQFCWCQFRDKEISCRGKDSNWKLISSFAFVLLNRSLSELILHLCLCYFSHPSCSFVFSELLVQLKYSWMIRITWKTQFSYVNLYQTWWHQSLQNVGFRHTIVFHC